MSDPQSRRLRLQGAVMRHHRKGQEWSMARSLVHLRILDFSAQACPFSCDSVAVLGVHASPFPISFTLFCHCLVAPCVHSRGSASKGPVSTVLDLGLELTAPGSIGGGRNQSPSTAGFGQL